MHALESSDDTAPGAITPTLAMPLLVDRSRPELPQAVGLLKNPA